MNTNILQSYLEFCTLAANAKIPLKQFSVMVALRKKEIELYSVGRVGMSATDINKELGGDFKAHASSLHTQGLLNSYKTVGSCGRIVTHYYIDRNNVEPNQLANINLAALEEETNNN